MLVDAHGKPLRSTKRPTQNGRVGGLHAKYDAAQDTPENRRHWSWADHDSAAAANSLQVRRQLRSRARYECHQANSYAKGICLTISNDTISSGPTLQVTHNERQIAKFIEKEWRKWARAVGLAAKLRTARLSKTIDGEIFLLKSTNRRLRTPVQLDIKLIEADQISTPGWADGQPDRVDGIEFDKWQQPVVYHLLKSHPGEMWGMNFDKEDISPDDIIHLFRVERPGQVRGIPEITPALPLFAYLRRWTLATIAASETAANHAAILYTQANDLDGDEYGDDDGMGGADYMPPFDSMPIERNMMTSLPRGWKMEQFKPEQPQTNYEMFRNAILNEIARCLHMPSNKALADSSRYNYSSGRLDHQTYYEAIDVERSQWELECMDRIFEWWLDEALMLSNYLPFSHTWDIDHEWRWNPPRHVDAEKEINAAIDAIDAGLMTEERYLLQQNIDPDVHYEQLERQARRRAFIASLGGPMGNQVPKPKPAPPAAPGASNATETAGAAVEAELVDDSPTGDLRDMNRRDRSMLRREIDDAMHRMIDGSWSESRFRVELESLGLKQRSIDSYVEIALEQMEELV